MLAPCVGLFVAIVYILMAIPSLVATPQEAYVSFRESIRLARLGIAAHPVFGMGPGTYAHAFFKWRVSSVGGSAFWNTPFTSGAGMVATYAVTGGVLGLLAWLSVVVFFLIRLVRGVVRDRRSGQFLAVHSAALVLLGMSLVLSIPLVLMGVLAIVFGLVFAEGEYTHLRMDRSAQGRLARNVVVGAALFLLVIGGVVLTRRTASAVSAVQALRIFPRDPSRAARYMVRAITFDPGHDGYWRMLADARRAELGVVLGNAREPITPERSAAVNERAAQAVQAARRATELSPQSSYSWTTLGNAYLAMGALSPSIAADAVKAFTQARTQNPYDPSIITSLGIAEAFHAKASATSSPDFSRATALLGEALAIQPQYVAAYLELARLYMASRDIEKAQDSYARARALSPYDPTIAYEIGAFLNQNKDVDGAIAEFERAIRLAPNFAQARLALADLYTSSGDKDKAVAQLEAIQKLIPDNKEIQARIDALKKPEETPKKKRR